MRPASLVLGAGIVVVLEACGAAPLAHQRGADPDPIGGILAAFGRKLQNVTQLLAGRVPSRIFVVWTVIGSSLGLRPRELRSTKTEIGARSFAELMPHNLTLFVNGSDGKPVPRPIAPSDLPPIQPRA